jgi:hypothetical protein
MIVGGSAEKQKPIIGGTLNPIHQIKKPFSSS